MKLTPIGRRYDSGTNWRVVRVGPWVQIDIDGMPAGAPAFTLPDWAKPQGQTWIVLTDSGASAPNVRLAVNTSGVATPQNISALAYGTGIYLTAT